MIRELQDIVAALLDQDVSCRKMDFEAPCWEGVKVLLGNLAQSFGSVTGSDGEGHTLEFLIPEAAWAAAKDRGGASVRLEGCAGVVKNLQGVLQLRGDR